ncbi:MAG TPA: hypothetical protein VIN03_08775 [Roseateles sp.]
MAIKRCPVCSGPIADWVIRGEFSCHHCHWALSANLGRAAVYAFASAAVAELAAFAAALLWTNSVLEALDLYAAVLGAAAGLVWAFTFHGVLRLKPIRPQRSRRDPVKAPAADPA